MESVVTEGSGKKAYIPGYRVGGKTGTADKIVDGRYGAGKVYSSFISLAPVDDPKVAILVVIDEPQGVHYGSLTAAPVAREILEDTLRYLEIEPKFNDQEAEKYQKNDVVVPEVRNLTLTEATKVLTENKLEYETQPLIVGNPDTIIIDQFPKPGAKIAEKSVIILYLKKE